VRVGMEASGHAGCFNDGSGNCSLSGGSVTQPRSERSGCASRRRIADRRSIGKACLTIESHYFRELFFCGSVSEQVRTR
jgi:hypothetical protein